MAMAGAADWFAQADPQYGSNIRNYYEHVREHDLLLTHTLITPQANRSKAVSQQADPFLAARIVEENDNGVVIRGARMLATIGPIADELVVMPSTVIRGGADDAPYAFALAIPTDTAGLRFLCRESFDLGRSSFDHPLASRYEEIDAIVIFDDVLVPYERCFVLRNPELCNGIYSETSAAAHMTHQVVTRTQAKTEYMLGLVSLLTEAIGIEGFQHVQEKTSEVIIAVEIVKALLRAAEADAAREPVGARHSGVGAAERLPELVPALLAALPGDPAPAGSERADGPADGSGCVRARTGGRRALPAGRGDRRHRPRPAVPPRLGHLPLRVRRAADACTSTSSSAIPSAWRARWSRATTASPTRPA